MHNILSRSVVNCSNCSTGRAISDVLLNNMCEVYNGKILDGRDKPIISALEYIREYLMRRIVKVLKVIEKSEGLLTPFAALKLETIKKDAAFYHVQWNGGDIFSVSGKPNHARVVDLAKRTCACRAWEITGTFVVLFTCLVCSTNPFNLQECHVGMLLQQYGTWLLMVEGWVH